MKTVIACKKEGIKDFSMIHDSFGTHASNIPTMHRILREQFVEIYSEDHLAKLTADIRSQLPEDTHKKFDKLVATWKPERGSLDINCVVDSPYFFA